MNPEDPKVGSHKAREDSQQRRYTIVGALLTVGTGIGLIVESVRAIGRHEMVRMSTNGTEYPPELTGLFGILAIGLGLFALWIVFWKER